jgi:cell shape-determining protein MreC
MRPNTLNARRNSSSPALQLALALVVALGLALAPRIVGETARAAWREAMRPGQVLLNSVVDLAQQRRATPDAQTTSAGLESEQQVALLSERVRRLEAELLTASAAEAKIAAELPPLLVTQTISARVLGRQSKAFLQSRDMLDVGRTRGVVATSLVVESPTASRKPSQKSSPNDAALIDRGRDANVEPGKFVLAGSRVWGKVAEAGLHTSTVQRVADLGYRDLVQLTTRREGRLQFAARGVLVGQGDGCKVELVEATTPVMVGDLVYTVDDGVLDVPLLYGRVARLERKPGAAHWEIWVEPALSAAAPLERVSVLKTEVNPSRVAIGR